MSAGSVIAEPKAEENESPIGHSESVATSVSKLLFSLSSGFRARLSIRSRPRQGTHLPSTVDLLAAPPWSPKHISIFPLNAPEKARLADN